MDLILEILSIPLVQSVLKIAFIILLFAMPLGTVLTPVSYTHLTLPTIYSV